MNTKVFCSDAERVYFGIRPKHFLFIYFSVNGSIAETRKIKIYDKTRERGTVSRSVTSGFFFRLAVEFSELSWRVLNAAINHASELSQKAIKPACFSTFFLEHV